MKKLHISSIVSMLVLLVLFSCQQEERIAADFGYVRLDINTNSYVNVGTKLPEEYNPKQIAVQIVNAEGNVVESTDDWETLAGTQIRLQPGKYTVKASSNGFDGSESGFEIPYYAGSQEVVVEAGKEVTASVTCTLANVKVTVNFDQTFVNTFQSAKSVVSSAIGGVNSLEFVMGQPSRSAYFPVGDLSATVSVVNKSGQNFSQTNEIKDVKARDHYILNYKVAESGQAGDITITVDETETVYTFTFNVSTEVTTRLAVNEANAWSSFAFIEGVVESTDQELVADNMTFEYRLASAQEWQSVKATGDGTNYSARLEVLSPGQTYSFRMVYRADNVEFASDVKNFTTEATEALPNGNMDSWFKSGRTWYAVSESDYNAGKLFWDSSNPGTTTGAGALVNKNPTQGNNTVVHTAGGYSAELKSQYASAFGIGKFAAASLYSGQFNSLVGTNGAKIDFGRPFTSRPVLLHGFYNYTSGIIDYVGGNTPAELGIVKGETPDSCAIYIALSEKMFTVDNTQTSTFIDFINDESIIAYGELPAAERVSTGGQWKEFTIPLKYKSLDRKPSYIIVVFSSSKYGDYFTGSSNSLMYVDDIELVYEDYPAEM